MDKQYENTQPNGQLVSAQAKNDFYHKHLAVSVISKKTEKIATAMYMVTDFVHESEPLRTQLRTLALALISGTRRISARSSEPHYALADEVIRTIDDTTTMLELATTIGLVSEMNGTILRSELSKVKTEIDQQYAGPSALFSTHPGYANIMLSPSMFEVSVPEKTPSIFDKGQDIYKGHSTATVSPQQVPQTLKQVPSGRDVLARKGDIGIKIARRNDVLNVVRSKGRASIKDVVSILKDISEKTVQRELLSLVKEGVLTKEGEKRWSTYRVAS